MKVLVLCHGNKYRSPLSAAVLAYHAPQPQVYVRSAGFREGGNKAALAVREYARVNGYDLDHHRSRQLTREDIAWADIVIYMSTTNLERLSTFLRRYKGRAPEVHGLGEFLLPPQKDIADPAFMPQESPQFTGILQQVVDASQRLAYLLTAKQPLNS